MDFLLADTTIEIVLKMLFLALSNADVEFTELGKFTWRSYITVRITSWIKLIDKKEFAKTALNENSETFMVYVAVPKVEPLIHLL